MKFNDNPICMICQHEYKENESKQLLHCGHLYHKSCLEKYENFQYNKPMFNCPKCRDKYHVYYEKFEYNSNYEQTLPFYYRNYYYPGMGICRKYIWEKIGIQYKKHKDSEWEMYQHEYGNNI